MDTLRMAATITTFVDVGAKVTKRMKELSEVGGIPESFGKIRTRLPLLMSAIINMQHVKENLPDTAQEAFQEVVQQCYEQASQLEILLQKVTVSETVPSMGKKMIKASISIIDEGRVHRIANELTENVRLLNLLNIAPAERAPVHVDRRPSVTLPYYAGAVGVFLVPFVRDDHFVGRENVLRSITTAFKASNKAAISGIGGIGKSQITIEYCYQYIESFPDAQVFWVYGGNIARFYQGYKKIAQVLDLPGWDDPDISILELVHEFLSYTTSNYLLIVDNADNIEHWWPGKYKSIASLNDPNKNLSNYLPANTSNGRMLITTRDDRVARKLTDQSKPINVHPMSNLEAKKLFISKLTNDTHKYDEREIDNLVEELDRLPLAVTQAAAFIEDSGTSIEEYIQALSGDEIEEFLEEELNDARRDEESVNSVFRTWKLSFDQIKKQKPKACDLLCLFAMLDRQSIPKSILKNLPEVTTSLTVLRSFNLITVVSGSENFSIHRLVQRFAQASLRRESEDQKWKDLALACISRNYPTEIGNAERTFCDSLAPHVQIVTGYEYQTKEAKKHLAHLLCWSADFDIERGMYKQALMRAQKSLQIYKEHVEDDHQGRAAATWLCGRLICYEAKTSAEIEIAADLLESALVTADYPSLVYAETAFELAYLRFNQGNENACFKMGKASFECWKASNGLYSERTLDNKHDHALQLAMFGHVEEGITLWQEIADASPSSDADEDTKLIFINRSMASISEFQDDPQMAEVFYEKVIAVCRSMYASEHIHFYDYLNCRAEQVLRQGRLAEAETLAREVLKMSLNKSEWEIPATAIELQAECARLATDFEKELSHRLQLIDMHEKHLGSDHKQTITAMEFLADCYLGLSHIFKAKEIYQKIFHTRNTKFGQDDDYTVRAIECISICFAHEGLQEEAEIGYLEAIRRSSPNPSPTLLNNLCICLWNQCKWLELEVQMSLLASVDKIVYDSLSTLINYSPNQTPGESMVKNERRILPQRLPTRVIRRFGRILHPRTWSA